MDFLQLATARYSVRRYKSTPVPQEHIDKILAAGRMAPTALNNQPQEIIVVHSDEGRALLRKCTPCHYDAPLAFIVCCDTAAAWAREYDGKSSGDIDAAIVTTHMMMEATELGLGTTWVMWFDPAAVTDEFGLPDGIEPVAILLAGYADVDTSSDHLDRRDVDEYVTYR